MPLANKKVLFIIAPQNFRDEELLEPKAVLEQHSIQITIASKGAQQALGSLGATVSVDIDYTQAQPEQYDAIAFIGGPGSRVYFNDPIAHQLAQNAYNQNKVIAGICSAASILANAGILQGKKATSFSGEQTNLQQKGAIYTGEGVTVDGKIVTADGPRSAREFGEKIAELLK